MGTMKYIKASWCGTCRQFEPILDVVMKDYPEVNLVKLDADTMDKEELRKYNVTTLPCIVYENNGYIKYFQPYKEEIVEFLSNERRK